MAEVSDYDGQIMQNLRDAGCTSEFIRVFMDLLDRCSTEEQSRLLRKHRKGLLDQTHRYQAQIDCLDYLIYKLNL